MDNVYCLIDIGTNNVLLLLVQVQGLCFSVINRLNRISALGEDMQDKKLQASAIVRLKRILTEYLDIAAASKAKPIIIGTSAVREAVNSQEISHWLKQEYNLALHAISGEKEAYYNGMANLDEFEQQEIMLFDIGGGSTEFTFIKDHEIKTCQSIPLGIRRLYNQFEASAFRRNDQVKKLLQSVNTIKSDNVSFVGIGGTVTSLAAIANKLHTYNEGVVHRFPISTIELQALQSTVFQASDLQVQKMIPFNPVSRLFLLTGIMIVAEIIAHFAADNFFVSDRTWQYGVLKEIIARGDEIWK